MQIIRSDDNVFLIGHLPTPHETIMECMKARMDRLCLALYEYKCPFGILDEFAQWWEWHDRVYFRKQSTGHVITAMLHDVDRIKAHKIKQTIRMKCDCANCLIMMPRTHIMLTDASQKR